MRINSSMRQSRHLLVTNLPDCITEDRISDHFKRYGKVQSVKALQPGCATVAFIDIRSAAKAFTSPDNLIDERVLKTEYYEPPASSTASSAIFIHDTRDDVLPRPANSHTSSGSASASTSSSAFSSSGRTRHSSLLTPAARSLSEDRLYEREQQRPGACNNYDRRRPPHHEDDLRSRIPRGDRTYRADRLSEGSDRKRRHLEVIKPVNSKDRTPDLRTVDKTPKMVDAADDMNDEVVRKTTTIITRILNNYNCYVENEPLSHAVVDAAVVHEPSPASDHSGRRSLSGCKSGTARVSCTPGKDSVPVRTVDAALAVNLLLTDPRRSSSSSSSVFPSPVSSRLMDSADAESGIVTSTDSLPHDVYASSHKNEDHGCEVSSSSDKPLVKTLTPKPRKESCMSLPLPEFAAEKVLSELTTSSKSQQAAVAPFTSISAHPAIPSPKNNAITSPINIFSPCPLPPKRLRECSTDSKGSEVTTSDRDSTENLCVSKHVDLSCEPPKKSPRSPKSFTDRIRALDERLHLWSHSSTTAMPATTAAAVPAKCDLPPTPTIDYSKYNIKKKSQVNQTASGDSQRSEPSDIVKNLLSKSSIFDQDSKRLEHINEKYEPSRDAAAADPLSANRPMFRTKAAAKEFAPSNTETDARRSSTSSSSSAAPVTGLASLSRKMSEPSKLPSAKKEGPPTTPLSAPARSFSNAFTPFSNALSDKKKETGKCPVTDPRREGDGCRDPRTQKPEDSAKMMSEKKPLIQKSHSMPSGSKNPSTQQMKSSDSRAFGAISEAKRWSSSDFMDTDSEPVKGDSKQISKQISNKSKIASSARESHSKSESGSCVKKEKTDLQKAAAREQQGQLKLAEKAARKSDAALRSPLKSSSKCDADRSHPKSEKSLKDKLMKKEQERKGLSGKNRSAPEGSKKKEKLSAKCKELRKLGITEEPVYLSMYDKVKARSSANQSLPKSAEPATAKSKSESKQSRKRDEDSSSGSDSDSSSGSGSEVELKRKRKRVIQSSSSSSSDEDSATGPSKTCSVKSSPRSSGLPNKSKSKSSIRAAVDSDSDSDERSSARKTKVKRKGVTSKKQTGSSAVLSSSSSSSSSDEADEEDEKDEDDERVPPRKKQQRKGLHKGSHRVSVSSDDQSPHEKRSADHLHNKKTKKAEKKMEKEKLAKRSKTQDRTSEKQRESDTTSKIKATEVREKSHAQPPPPPSASKAAFCESSNKLARKKNKSFLKEKERLKDFSLHKKHSPDKELEKSQHDKCLHNSDSSGSPKKKKFKKEDSSSRDRTSLAAATLKTGKPSKPHHCDPDHKRSSDSSDLEMHLGHSLLPSDLSDSDSLPKTKAPAVISHTEWERSECGKVSSKPAAGLSSKTNRKMSGSLEKIASHDRSDKTSFEKIISINDSALFEKKKHADSMSEIRRARASSGSSDQDVVKQKQKPKKLHRDTACDRSLQKDVLSFACIAGNPERKPSPPLVSSTSDNMMSVLLKSPASSDSPLIRDNLSECSEDMKLDRDLTEAAQRTAEKAEHLESDASSDDLMISAGSDDVPCLPKNREDKERPQRSLDLEAAIETKRLEVELNQSWKSEPAHHFDGLICSTTAESIAQPVDEEPAAAPDPELAALVLSPPEAEQELRDPSPPVAESSQEKDGDGKEDHRRMEDDLAVSALLQEMDDGHPEQETGIEEMPYLSILTDEEPPLHISEESHSEQLKQAISSVLPHDDSKDSSAAHAPDVKAVADPIPKSAAEEIQQRNSAAKERKATPEPSVDILSAFNRSPPVKRHSTETQPLAETTVAPAVVTAPTPDETRSPKRLSQDTDPALAETTPSSAADLSEVTGTDNDVMRPEHRDDDLAGESDEKKCRTRKAKLRKPVVESVAAPRPEKAETVPAAESGAIRRRAGPEKIRRSPRVASLDPEPAHQPGDTHDELSGDELHSKLPLSEVSDHADESDPNEQKKRRGRRKKASGDSHIKIPAEPVVAIPEPKVPVKERLHVHLPAVDKPAADARKSLSPYDVFDFRDDDDESPLPLSMPPLKAVEPKQVVAPVAPPAVEEKKIAMPVPAAAATTTTTTTSPSLLPVPSVPTASVTTIAAISCEELPLKIAAAALPESQDKKEAEKEKDAKYITEFSGHGKLSMTIRLQKEGQADGGTAEIVKTSVKVPEELPKPVKPAEDTDVVKATRKSARLMSQNKSTIDEVIEDVIKGKSMGECELRMRRMQRSGRKSEDSAVAPDVSEDGYLSDDAETWDRNLRSYRLTRSSTRGSTGGEDADTADEGSNPAPAQKRQSGKTGEVSDRVADQEPPDDSSVSETPVIEPLVPHPPPPPASLPPQTASDVPAVTRKDAEPISSQTAEAKRLVEDAAPIEEAATPSDKLMKAEPQPPACASAPAPPPTAATPSVIQEPHRTPLIPSVSERIHNSTTAQKLKTGKGLEYLIEEPAAVPADAGIRVDDEKNHVAAVQPPPAHTKITIEAKQPSIQTSIVQSLPPEKRSPVAPVVQVGRATRTPELMPHHMPHFGREVDQNLQQGLQHLVPHQQKEYLAAVQQQEMAHRLQQEQRLAPVATPPPSSPLTQLPAAPHHMRPMVMPLPPDRLPYNIQQMMFQHPYGMHPEYPPPHLQPRMPGYGLPIAVDQKDAIRATMEKEEQKMRSRAKAADEARERIEQQQRADLVADEEALKRLHMASNQMRGMPYLPSRLPPHLLSPHERVSDSPAVVHSFHPPRQHMPGSGDHKAEFQHSPIPKSDVDRKPAVPYQPAVVSSADMSRSFGIASPAPTYLDGRPVHPAVHSPGTHAFRPKVPSPMGQREDELRKLHHMPYGKEMSSPVGLNTSMAHTAGGYHLAQMQHHMPGDHSEGLLSRGHSQMGSEASQPSHLMPQPSLRPHSPPHATHATQGPASGDSILLLRYPVVWQGLLALKNDQAAVQMHFISGCKDIAYSSLPPVLADGPSPVRISQRMRLEQTQLEGVARKMQMEKEHCILLALPCGRDHADVLQQSNNLKSGFISYLQSKQAAGIVNSSGPGPQATSFVIHIFPSSDFSTDSMSRIAPDLLHGISDIAHLMIIIATV